MADCPIAADCPSFSERISGMGCQYYGNRGGKQWCNHYKQPIEDLKSAPVVPGEEVDVDVTDLHESGAAIDHDDDGFVIMVDGVLPEARARVRVNTIKRNYAKGILVEKLPMDAEETDAPDPDAEEDSSDDADDSEKSSGPDRERLGSRDNFWGS